MLCILLLSAFRCQKQRAADSAFAVALLSDQAHASRLIDLKAAPRLHPLAREPAGRAHRRVQSQVEQEDTRITDFDRIQQQKDLLVMPGHWKIKI